MDLRRDTERITTPTEWQDSAHGRGCKKVHGKNAKEKGKGWYVEMYCCSDAASALQYGPGRSSRGVFILAPTVRMARCDHVSLEAMIHETEGET